MSSAANATARITLANRNEAIREALARPDGQRPTLKALAIEHGLSVERVRQIGDRIKQIGPDVSRLTSRDGSRILIESKFDGGYDVYLQPARKPRTFLGSISGIRQRWIAFADGHQIAAPQRNLACACEEILAVYQASLAPVEQAPAATDQQIAATTPIEHAAPAPDQEGEVTAAVATYRFQSIVVSPPCLHGDAANDPVWIGLMEGQKAGEPKQQRAGARRSMHRQQKRGSLRHELSTTGAIQTRRPTASTDLTLHRLDPSLMHATPFTARASDAPAWGRTLGSAPPFAEHYRQQ